METKKYFLAGDDSLVPLTKQEWYKLWKVAKAEYQFQTPEVSEYGELREEYIPFEELQFIEDEEFIEEEI